MIEQTENNKLKETQRNTSEIKSIQGNIIDLAAEGHFDVIIQGCNCFNKMGSGLAKEIRARIPEAYEADCKNNLLHPLRKLGDFSSVGCSAADILVYRGTKVFAKENHSFTVINAYTQYKPGSYKKHPAALYEGIRAAMRSVAVSLRLQMKAADVRIGVPLIGCGIAGGDWAVVQTILKVELQGFDWTVVHFEEENLCT